MLPIASVKSGAGLGPGNVVYNFADPNSVDFTYTYLASDTTINTSTGLGYYNTSEITNSIAHPNYFCSNNQNKQNGFSDNFPNWLSTINAQIDLRGFMVKCVKTGTNQWTYQSYINPVPEVLGTMSSYTKVPVAYTTEALYYAQSGYFVTVVMVQWSNVFACKSRKVILFLILVLIDLLWCQQTHVRWYCL